MSTGKIGHRKIGGVILAGGRSTRMGGGDKCLLPLEGRPLLSWVAGRLGPQVAKLALNANGAAARFDSFGLPVVADAGNSFEGPLAGILAGLRWAEREGFETLVTVAADTPFLPLDLVDRLTVAQGSEPRIAVAATGGRRHPTFAAWSTALIDPLADFLLHGKTRKVTAFIDDHPSVTVDFAAEPLDPFFNINCPDDLKEACILAAKLHEREG